MHHALVVRVLQRFADGRDDGEGLRRLQFSVADEVAEVHAVHELHHDVEQAAGLAEVVDRDDVRMAELRQQLGLAGETFGEARVALALGGEDLDRDEAVEGFLAGLVNDAHAAAPETLDDLELRKLARDLLRRRRRDGAGLLARREDRARGERLGQQAGRAEPVLPAGRQGLAALGTKLSRVGVHRVLLLRVDGISLQRRGEKLTR